MNTTSHWWRAAALALLLLPLGAGATIKLEISPASYRFADMEGGGTTQARFDILVTGLTDGVAVAAYDFGLIYDPAIMTLATGGFLGFTDRLGNSAATPDPEVLNFDHTDPYNAAWDYRNDHENPDQFGAYRGSILGTPIEPDQARPYREGSLRFAQFSSLDRVDLLTLQDYSTINSLVLFSLVFDVNTTGHKTGTPLAFVDDRDYEGWTEATDVGLLDVKLSTPADEPGALSSYLPRDNGSVWVPIPAVPLLLLSGLALLGLTRRRARAHPQTA